MIFIKFSSEFKLHFAKISRNKKLKLIVDKKIKIFSKNQNSKVLKNHKLRGKMRGQWAFSITDDIRIVYKRINKNTIRFLDIGTHKEVYRS